MSANSTNLIDKAVAWVSERDGAYLAKENVITYYASLTGRASDFTWHEMNLAEVVRVIKATRLTHDSELNQNHIIAACQELGRVYEFGVKNMHDTIPSIFNYYKEARMTIEDSVMEFIIDECMHLNFVAMLYADIVTIFDKVVSQLGGPEIHAKYRNRIAQKYMNRHNYTLRIGDQRVKYQGKLTQAVLLVGHKPSEIVNMDVINTKHIITKAYGALK